LIRFPWGDLELTVLDAGSIWLDGGAMFGIVPKALWQDEREPDSANRIRLALNLLLVNDGKQLTLVDTGAGLDWTPKQRAIYRLETPTARELLSPAGVGPDDIDRVINSHLHFDHAGGNTTRDGERDPAPTFPNAEYVMARGEIDLARSSNERIRASYRASLFEPLLAQGRVRTVEGETAIGKSLRLVPAPGHTPHMLMVLVETGQGTLAFPADLMPTASHVRLSYVMAYDLEPLTTMATKKRVLSQAATEGWRIVFEHDDRLPLAVLVEVSGRLQARAVEF